MNSFLKISASAALFSIAAFFVFLAFSVRHAVVRVDRAIDQISWTAAAAQSTIQQLQPAITELKPTIVDTRRTIEIAGGTINLARDTMRNEQESIRQANQQTISTMRNLDELVAGAGQSQKAIAEDLAKTFETVPPVMAQTQTDLASLDLAITDMRPLLANSTATMANAARISSDLAKITDDATKQQPWYKRMWGYIWAPVKLAAVFTK